MSTSDSRPTAADSQFSNDTEQLRERIASQGLSQRTAARELGIGDRLMRHYCAGDPPPPPMVRRALDPAVRHYEFTKQSIADKLQAIQMLESGEMTVGAGPGPGTREQSLAEAQRLRRQVEELQALLRQEEAFRRRQRAVFMVMAQFHETGRPSAEHIAEVEAAEAEWRAAQQEVQRLVHEIRDGRR
jgi:hypothetical protein